MDTMTEYLLTGTKYLMILLSVIILIRCLRSMFSVRYDPEVWGYMRVGNERIPVNHWENLIGLPLGGHPCRPRGRQPSARRSHAQRPRGLDDL